MTDTATTGRPTAPALRSGVVPYLTLDRATDAIDFYRRALGAEEVGERTVMEGRICNARIDVNGASIMLMDPFPERGHPAASPQAFSLHLQVDDADRWFNRATAAGCTVVMPVDLQFWGDRFGMVKDHYGVVWSFGSTPA